MNSPNERVKASAQRKSHDAIVGFKDQTMDK
jgi:hypothetical protein